MARAPSPPKVAFGAAERAFLPAALEVIETPPAPLARFTALTICAVVLAAIVWSAVGKVDIISIATGKIVAPSHTQVVQPLEGGSIKAIMVTNGAAVKAGQPLLLLDDTDAAAEFAKATADLNTARLDEARLTGIITPSAPDPFTGLGDIEPSLIDQAKLRLASQRETLATKLAGYDQQKLEKQAELETARESASKDDLLLPLVQQVADIRSKASQMQYGDYLELADAQQQLVSTQSDRRLQDLRINAATAALAELDQERQQTQAEFTEQAYVDLAHARSEADAARSDLAKAKYALQRMVLRSPLDGEVTSVNVHTVGAVVTPGEQLISIVSDSEPITIEAVLPNEEVGFVRAGQTADVKVDAYPFTRYGLLKGTVQSVSQDAEALTQTQGPATGPQLASDQAQTIEGSQRLVYRVDVTLDGNTLIVDGKPAQLIPGMAVSAEIKTGQRTVLDFLLAPLAEFVHDGLRER